MADPGMAFHLGKRFGRKAIGNKTVPLVFVQGLSVVRGDPRTLLAPVLQRVQGVVQRERYPASIHDANDTAHGGP